MATRKRAKTATIEQVKGKQEKRSKRARAADAAGTAKSTFSTLNRDGLGRWVKSPRRHDVSGVDTKGAGKAPRVAKWGKLVKKSKKRK